jgi:hypothetical protein
MRVVVIDTSSGKIVHAGESDGKRRDGIYVKVDKDMYHAHCVFPEGEVADMASAMFATHAELRRSLNERLDAEAYRFFNTYAIGR